MKIFLQIVFRKVKMLSFWIDLCMHQWSDSFYNFICAFVQSVISMEQQMEYFKEYKSKMEFFIGKENTLDLIKKSVFMISGGTNDYIVNYYELGELVTQAMYPNVTDYHNFLLQNIEQFIKVCMFFSYLVKICHCQ